MDGLLPVGSVVLLKGGTRKTIIMGYLQFDENDKSKIYDYMGVPFPEGYMGMGSAFLFNHDAVEKVFFKGYEDENVSKLMAVMSAVFESAVKTVNDLNEDGKSKSQK